MGKGSPAPRGKADPFQNNLGSKLGHVKKLPETKRHAKNCDYKGATGLSTYTDVIWGQRKWVNKFASWVQSDPDFRSLLYFKQPELETGTVGDQNSRIP